MRFQLPNMDASNVVFYFSISSLSLATYSIFTLLYKRLPPLIPMALNREREIVGVCVFNCYSLTKGAYQITFFFLWLPHNCTRNKKIEPLRDKVMVKNASVIKEIRMKKKVVIGKTYVMKKLLSVWLGFLSGQSHAKKDLKETTLKICQYT
ncbi:predicted protein [Lodderomyces elongisporus NRRL YB-4239]|uniref:Uncharacterized protein n=1 Tax=Lodderomyces elongisporus (strain ATCC 11503 / CBS 2605 / JCM 1781 / NBRC 1676 / NRRL YB-4239) TaxID=379508 RepID=A5E3G0_LODEL|nr:predicted protein [Lodderomyces elongisporus NRRL YB-4239]